jgi:hypothetical protein
MRRQDAVRLRARGSGAARRDDRLFVVRIKLMELG